MHICIIANSFQEDYIVNLLDNLKEKVERIDLIGSTIHEDRSIDDKVNFYNFRGKHEDTESFIQKSLRILKYFFHLLTYLKSTNASIIHVQWLRFHILEGIFLTLYIKALGKKVVYTAHDVLPRSGDNLYNRFIFKIIYKTQDLIIVHTSYIRDRIINEFKVNPKKIHVVTHGVYQRVESVGITREKAREYFRLSLSSTVILFFGIIAEYKGFDVLLESLKDLDSKRDFQVLVAGKIKAEYKEKFEALVSSYKEAKIVFVLRYIKDEEIEYCFKASNVTILPYKEASQSGVMFMSYAYGIPVIAPHLGGFPEDIVPGKSGYLFEPNNPKNLGMVLLKFQKEWPLVDLEIGNNIKQYFIANYSWNKTCNEIVELYRTLKCCS